jgi:hypothetical protein
MNYLNVLKKQLEDLDFEDTTAFTEQVDTTWCDQVSFQILGSEIQAVGTCYALIQRSIDGENWDTDGTDGDVQTIGDGDVVFLAGAQPLVGNYYRVAATITGGGEMSLETYVLGKGFV